MGGLVALFWSPKVWARSAIQHFAAGAVLAALALELFFLNLSGGSEFSKVKSKRWQGLLVNTGISALMLVGAFIASLILREASDATIAVGLAFGSAALIYLIAEELLVEAIQAEESLLSTAMLFAGFLVLLALKLLS